LHEDLLIIETIPPVQRERRLLPFFKRKYYLCMYELSIVKKNYDG